MYLNHDPSKEKNSGLILAFIFHFISIHKVNILCIVFLVIYRFGNGHVIFSSLCCIQFIDMSFITLIVFIFVPLKCRF